MALNADLSERIGIWLIELRWNNQGNVTLWARANEEDWLLAVGKRILVFSYVSRLLAFVSADTSSNLSNLSGYHQLRNLIDDMGDGGGWQPYATCDFDRVLQLLSEEVWANWSLESCNEVLNALNLLWDAAVTLGEETLIAGMKGTQPLGEFMNTLTFIEPQERPTLDGYDKDAIRSRIRDAWTRVRSAMHRVD